MIVSQLLNVAKDKDAWPEELAVGAMHILDELIKKRERVCLFSSRFSTTFQTIVFCLLGN